MVLGITFTNKAAKEMLFRVEQLLGQFPKLLWGGTFHHVANLLLRKYAKAIGYENAYLRGMELYVADGQHYSVLNPTLKYNIVPTKVVTIDWLSFLKKFSKIHFALYGKAFADFGYVYNKYRTLRSNNLSNKFLYSTGIGLDFVTYYDINLSIEYSFNMLNKGGVFFTFKGPLI